jgi:hypothetical protein
MTMNQANKPWIDGTLMHRIEMAKRANAARKSPEATFRRAARLACNASRSLHVEIVEGNAAPSIQGEQGGYVYGEGYEPPTLRVVVGADWKAE